MHLCIVHAWSHRRLRLYDILVGRRTLLAADLTREQYDNWTMKVSPFCLHSATLFFCTEIHDNITKCIGLGLYIFFFVGLDTTVH